jgi:hypothetical protein
MLEVIADLLVEGLAGLPVMGDLGCVNTKEADAQSSLVRSDGDDGIAATGALDGGSEGAGVAAWVERGRSSRRTARVESPSRQTSMCKSRQPGRAILCVGLFTLRLAGAVKHPVHPRVRCLASS